MGDFLWWKNFIYIIVSLRDEIGEKVESAIYMKNPLK